MSAIVHQEELSTVAPEALNIGEAVPCGEIADIRRRLTALRPEFITRSLQIVQLRVPLSPTHSSIGSGMRCFLMSKEADVESRALIKHFNT